MTTAKDRVPDEDDERLFLLVAGCLDRGRYVAKVSREWVSGPRAWVITVEPGIPEAATLTMWVRDGEFWIGVGHSYAEIFGAQDDEGWDLTDRIVEAVFAGKVEEAGYGQDRIMRAYTRSGRYTFGRLSLPMPWRWRKRRTFAAYRTSN